MVKGTLNSTVTYYPFREYLDIQPGGTEKIQKYYMVSSQMIAVSNTSSGQTTLNWVLSDQVGSTTVTANADGTWNSEIRYSAFGEIRYSNGITQTNYRYTGQLAQAELGLDYYVARWYDPVIAHFAQADSEAPHLGQSQTFDRYMYANQNPIRFNDPTGHDVGRGSNENMRDENYPYPYSYPYTYINPYTYPAQYLGSPIGTPKVQPVPVAKTKSIMSGNSKSGPVYQPSNNYNHAQSTTPVPNNNRSPETPTPNPDTKPPVTPVPEQDYGWLGDLLNNGSLASDLGEHMNWLHIPSAVGFGIDFTAQAIKDYGHYNVLQITGRGIIVASEGQLISKVAGGLGVAAGLQAIEGTPVATLMVGGAVFVLASRVGSKFFDQVNEAVLFPLIDN